MKARETNVTPDSEYYLYEPSQTARASFLYPLRCGLFRYLPGYRLRRNAFDSFLLLYLLKGSMEFETQGASFTAGEGTFVLLDCYAPHAYGSANGAECLWIHFDGPLARNYYDIIQSRHGNVQVLPDALPIISSIRSMIDVFAHHGPVREPLFFRDLTEILTSFMLYGEEIGRRSRNSDLCECVVSYINEHFAEQIQIKELAELTGFSPYYFIRVFREETGFTPHEYLMNRRMASAEYLLRTTSLSIKEICYSSGFSGESVFCNAFKTRRGVSPQPFRMMQTA